MDDTQLTFGDHAQDAAVLLSDIHSWLVQTAESLEAEAGVLRTLAARIEAHVGDDDSDDDDSDEET
jgi:hypothetical protein